MVENNKIFEKMVEANTTAIESQETSYKMESMLKEHLTDYIMELVDGIESVIFIDRDGYVHIRVTEELLKSDINLLLEEFELILSWVKKEFTIDYRNVDPVEVTIYEYGLSHKSLFGGEND